MLVIRLLRPVARAVDWTPLAAAGVLVVLLVSLIGTGSALDPEISLMLLRMAGVLLGTAAGFAVVDAMDASTAAAPAPRGLRHRIRCALGGLTAAAFWAVACAVAVARLPQGGTFPVPGAAVEAAACVAAGLLAASVAGRVHQGKAAALAGTGGLLGVVAVSLALRGPYRPWIYPDEDTWGVVHRGWLAALALLLLALDLTGRGPRRTR
ncbi:hypothetical protein GCM10010156_04910 [Planobispora rosea]|uniref:ABC transporter n=1 Tax=Planobispora rosea TaxID=35762 RepID=A0A8J3RYR8_PLARO|nr:hypothetical protein [Planobispora rosea]GGS49262.1 hypothetical protein GCM10010156_04910 [Planobispora rosea]GIH83775.1 hypothetical protein Pro02_21830 [Planobispora rosea]